MNFGGARINAEWISLYPSQERSPKTFFFRLLLRPHSPAIIALTSRIS